MQKLPKRIYLKRENEGDKDNEFLSVTEDAKSLVEMGEIVRIGEYELTHEFEYQGEAVCKRQVG